MLRMQGATKMIVLGKNVSGKADIQPNVKFTRGEAAKIIVIGKNLSGKSDVLPSTQAPRGETIKTDVLPAEVEIKDAAIKKGKIFANINSLLNLFEEKPKDIKIGGKFSVSKTTGDPANPSKVRSATVTLYPDALAYEKYEYTPNAQNTGKATLDASVAATLYQVEAEAFVGLLNWVFEKSVELEVREDTGALGGQRKPISPGDRYLTEDEMQINATLICDYLIDQKQKWSLNAICALLGNIEVESTINSGKCQEGGGTGFGLIQWTYAPMKRELFDYLDTNGYARDDFWGQLYCLLGQLSDGSRYWSVKNGYSNYKMSFDSFRTSDTESVKYLTQVFLWNFEKPEPPYDHTDRRIKAAEKWKAYFINLGYDKSK